MWTFLKKLFLILVLLFVVVLLAVHFLGGAAIKQAVNTGGPLVLGVPVRLETAQLRPLAGRLHLGGLFVGNPEGFKTESLFQMGHLSIDLDPRSLLQDTIRIRRIQIHAPEITLEQGLRSNNIGALLEKLEKKTTGAPRRPKPDNEAEKPASGGKRVEIDEIIVSDGRLNVSATGLAGSAATVPLPEVVIRDLGKTGDGTSIAGALAEVVKTLLVAAAASAGDVANLLGEGAKALGEGAQALGDASAEGLKVAGDAVADSAKAVDEAAAAAKEKAGQILKGVGNILKRGQDP